MNSLQLKATLFLHFLLFLFLCVAFAWQAWKCVALYNLGDTSIKMQVVKAENTRFPTVMINPGFKLDVLEQLGLTEREYLAGDWSEKDFSPSAFAIAKLTSLGLNYGDYLTGDYSNENTQDKEVTVKPEELYKMVTSELIDVLDTLTIIYHDGRVVEENPHEPIKTKEQKSGSKGESYQFLYADVTTPEGFGFGHGVSKMLFKFKNTTNYEALTVSIQHPGRLFAPEISLSTFKLNSGVRTTMTVRDSIIYLLDKESYPCVPLPDDEKVFYDDCQDDYVKEELRKEVNCRLPWVRDPNLPVCTSRQHKRASDIYFKSQQSPPCLQPCCTMEIDVVNKFVKKTKDDSTVMELRFPPTIKFYQEIVVYGFVSMLAEVAGYLGMFLGVSFFDLRIIMDLAWSRYKEPLKMQQNMVMVTPVAE